MYEEYYTPSPNPARRRYEGSRRYQGAVSSRGRHGYEADRRYPDEYYTRGRPEYENDRRYPDEYYRSRRDDTRSIAYDTSSPHRRNHGDNGWESIGVYYTDDELKTPTQEIPHEHHPPRYVRGSRHHGYPKHVFTGRRDNGDTTYYFTKKADIKDVQDNKVNQNLKHYRVVRHGHQKADNPDDIYLYSDLDDDDDFYERRRNRRKGHKVHVKIEHWKGVIGQSVYDELRDSAQEVYDENAVTFEEKKGWLDTFEVYINDQLMFSRSRNGGYPNTYDFLDEVRRARHGRPVRRLRSGDSRVCTIL